VFHRQLKYELKKIQDKKVARHTSEKLRTNGRGQQIRHMMFIAKQINELTLSFIFIGFITQRDSFPSLGSPEIKLNKENKITKILFLMLTEMNA
jgi:hypothetical protein